MAAIDYLQASKINTWKKNMMGFSVSLCNVSLFLTIVMTLVKAKTVVNRCRQDSSVDGSCIQECDEDCKMSCVHAKPPIKSCDQTCFDGQCDMKCVTKEMCYQDCQSFLDCGSVFCKTANCTQFCDEGTCNLSCRANDRCKQSCNAGSCHLKCPKTSQNCYQSCWEGNCPTLCSAKRLCEQDCNEGSCPMRCTTDKCHQSCNRGKCKMKCRTRNDCVQECSPFFNICPLVDCKSKEKSCKQLGGGKKMIIRAKEQGYQQCSDGDCQQNCTSTFRCYQYCKGRCHQHCTTGEKCYQSCFKDGNCQQSCISKTCVQSCTKGLNCNMTCNTTDQCEQQCSEGGCQGVCDSPSCLQLCDSGNCSMTCNGLQCRQNCTGGGCNLTCYEEALCEQHCGAAENCIITRKMMLKTAGHLDVTSTSGDHGIQFERGTTDSGNSLTCCLTLFTLSALVIFAIVLVP